jgi:hypothetical protein
MSVVTQRFLYCFKCVYAVWPVDELGYCAHPDALKSTTAECRNPSGACGTEAKLYKEMNRE